MSARIQPLVAPYAEDVQKSFDQVMPEGMPPLNIFRTVGVNPRVLKRMVSGGLLDRGSVSIAQRELVILRSCANCGAEYEWGVHVAGFAKAAGLNKTQIDDTCRREISPHLWSEEQLLLIELCDQLHETQMLNGEIWQRLKADFSDEQIVELVMLAGLYHAVSFVVNALGVEKEPFAPSFSE